MKARTVTFLLAGIFLVGFILRMVAVAIEPAHHPDEYFQYLEPAWLRLQGSGVETWEWRDGVRSWFLPGYHGAWIAALLRLGVHNGRVIITLLHIHWALLSLLLVWAGWRGGALLTRWHLRKAGPLPVDPSAPSAPSAPPAGWQGGLLGAFLCATFPLLVRFSVHTLSELASLLCLVCALVLAGELGEEGAVVRAGKVVWLGLLLGLGVCLRIQHATVPFFAGLWLLWTRRSRTFLAVTALAFAVVGLFGVLDRLTWGEFLATYIRYVKFNVIQDGAAMFGTEPSGWYWDQFLHRLPYGIYALGFICLFGLRSTWPFVGSAATLVLLLSTQGHKEERFVMLCWPLLLIAAGGTVGGWLASAGWSDRVAERLGRTWQRWGKRVATVGAALLVVGVLVDATFHFKGNDFGGLDRERVQAHVWIAQQPDVTGLLYDAPFYVQGYMGFSHPFPQVEARAPLLSNPLFSHLLLPRSSGLVSDAERAGFKQVFSAGDFVVLRRPPPVQN